MTYDQWKTSPPEEELEHKCPECGKPVDKKVYCSTDCFKASLL